MALDEHGRRSAALVILGAILATVPYVIINIAAANRTPECTGATSCPGPPERDAIILGVWALVPPVLLAATWAIRRRVALRLVAVGVVTIGFLLGARWFELGWCPDPYRNDCRSPGLVTTAWYLAPVAGSVIAGVVVGLRRSLHAFQAAALASFWTVVLMLAVYLPWAAEGTPGDIDTFSILYLMLPIGGGILWGYLILPALIGVVAGRKAVARWRPLFPPRPDVPHPTLG